MTRYEKIELIVDFLEDTTPLTSLQDTIREMNDTSLNNWVEKIQDTYEDPDVETIFTYESNGYV